LNGGTQCWVTRIGAVATPGVASSITLKDQSATPQSTLSLQAGFYGGSTSPGTWGNAMYVDVVANSAATGAFNLNIYSGGYGAQYLVEQWNDLNMVKGSARYAPTLINAIGSGSMWVVATDLNDSAASPLNAPTAVTQQQLIGGIDVSDPVPTDRESAVTVGTSAFDYVQGPFNFNMPGESTLAVITTAITYATTGKSYSFLVVDTASGQTPANAVSFEQSLSPVSANAAVYYPWVNMSNPANNNGQSTILVPPGGFVLGQYASIDASQGVWWGPAGALTALSGVASAERLLSAADLSNLNLANVNAIKTRADGSVIIGGLRTLQQGYASLYVPVQRTLNYIAASLAQILDHFVFGPNDGASWATIVASCVTFLNGLLSVGAFAGSTPSTAFYVICDSTNNTQQSISQGLLNVTVGVALQYPTEFIALNLTQFQGTTTVTTSTT
jgi:phage tail sheath protein FI